MNIRNLDQFLIMIRFGTDATQNAKILCR